MWKPPRRSFPVAPRRSQLAREIARSVGIHHPSRVVVYRFLMDAADRRSTDQHSLFDRIARQIAEGPGGAADETAELRRPDAEVADASPPGGVVLEPTGGWPAPDISTQIERPIIANRQCSRSGCSEIAAVTLSYHYATSQVWIDHLTPERDPHQYDLCDRHADRLSVMRGWHLDDRRSARRRDLIAV